ncbi:hypothetical protein COO91_03834 [Nostoc flagelliforme CCNUN1]|uniref:Uncharacterized protein n=1 Tax=Nostoc flagelliforme CCNUN1 TaxID=2038116 RepID=A0A2K8SQZ2_9NOSO|nr:hypothetical protein COO91_03834 [Nostoc flagelliforme CCNUN1]
MYQQVTTIKNFDERDVRLILGTPLPFLSPAVREALIFALLTW